MLDQILKKIALLLTRMMKNWSHLTSWLVLALLPNPWKWLVGEVRPCACCRLKLSDFSPPTRSSKIKSAITKKTHHIIIIIINILPSNYHNWVTHILRTNFYDHLLLLINTQNQPLNPHLNEGSLFNDLS